MNRYLINWVTNYGEERESILVAPSSQVAVDTLRKGYGDHNKITAVFLLTDMKGNWK